MKIKSKLRLGFSFLVLVVLGFGGISLYHINRISEHAKVVLKDNYKSLTYVNSMRKIMDEEQLRSSVAAQQNFLAALRLEEQNITETGEKNAALGLRGAYFQALTAKEDQIYRIATLKMRQYLRQIDELNMKAIVNKHNKAQQATENATIYLGLTAFVCFLILFSFLINFPGYIANPIRELMDGIEEISRKNYQTQLHFEGKDEFGELAEAFNKMARALRNWEQSQLGEILSEKKRIETIIEQMQDGIIGCDEKQQILFYNEQASKLLHLTPKANIGTRISTLAERNELLAAMVNSASENQVLKIVSEGTEQFFQLEVREISAPNQNEEDTPLVKSQVYAGRVYILKNVTKYKELDEAKTHFIATISHELKTPISSLKMGIKLLNDKRVGILNPEQQQLLNHLDEDSNRLLKITGELLDLAQVETGNLQLQLNQTKAEEIVTIAVDAVRLQAEQKQISLKPPQHNLELHVMADLQKTAWVLVNFLSNALRYSKAGGEILLEVQKKDKFLIFSVQDFGNGIDPQYQSKLFERYYQVPTDSSNKSGSGLGLAISKDFIEAEQGSIWVESELGVGSKFCFSLPLA